MFFNQYLLVTFLFTLVTFNDANWGTFSSKGSNHNLEMNAISRDSLFKKMGWKRALSSTNEIERKLFSADGVLEGYGISKGDKVLVC